MKNTLITGLFLSFTFAHAEVKYYGVKSTEAILTFEGQIRVEAAKALTVDQLNGTTARADEIAELVEYQLSFLIGHFQSASFIENFSYPGVLGDDQEVEFTDVSEVKNGFQTLTYSYKGKTNFHTDAFGRKKNINVPLRMPLDPYEIYSLGLVRGINRCTDEHYHSEGDLFYFWDPAMPGCPLKKNKKDVLHITGQLQKLANTTSTYPEYDKLYSSPDLKIAVLLGYIEDDPFASNTKDDAYIAYSSISEELVSQGFRIAEESTFNTINHLTRFEKLVLNQMGQHQKVSVNVLLSDSSMGISDDTFTDAYTDALKNSQIVAYDGHSGLGGNLDIERFAIDKLPAKYQIYFFNGCSSYPYFNQMYFNAKPGGKKNLEIVTSGLPTLASTSADNMLAFLDPFLKGKTASYQSLMKKLETSNGEEETYLFGVNGDEDNKFVPEGRGR